MLDRRVRFSRTARADAETIVRYLLANNAVDAARTLTSDLRTAQTSLLSFPNRGARPKELPASDYRTVRQLLIGAIRVFYLVEEEVVTIFMVTDGRRNVAAMLEQRLRSRRSAD